MTELILQDILKTTITSSIIICLLLTLRKTLFKLFNKKFNYYIWLIVFIRLLFPFAYFTYTINSIDNKLILSNNNISISPNIILFIWLSVTTVCLINTISKYIKFKSLVDDLSFDIEDTEINNCYNNILNELKIKKDIKLRYTYEVNSPSYFGLFEHYVLLPPHDYTLKELDWIFRHELIHCKSNDLYIRYLTLFLKCVYWFNPFIYILDRVVEDDCEMCCDETVLRNKSFDDRKDYAMTVLNSIERHSNSSNIFSTGLHRVKNFELRVDNMLTSKTRKGILLALILCLLSSFTYLKFDFITSDSLLYSMPKPDPIHTKSKYKFSVED